MSLIANLFDFKSGSQAFRYSLFAMLAVDTALIVMHLAAYAALYLGWLATVPRAVSLFGDSSSAAELFTYLKWCITVAALTLIFVRCRVPLFLGLAITFAVILTDDALGLHERGALLITARFPDLPKFGLTRHVVGELLVWAILGIGVVGACLWGWLGSPRLWRKAALPFFASFCMLILFAVGIDVMQIPLLRLTDDAFTEHLSFSLNTIESAGEVVVGSLTAAVAIATHVQFDRAKVADAKPIL
jgi:hypothetical protein